MMEMESKKKKVGAIQLFSFQLAYPRVSITMCRQAFAIIHIKTVNECARMRIENWKNEIL